MSTNNFSCNIKETAPSGVVPVSTKNGTICSGTAKGFQKGIRLAPGTLFLFNRLR